MTDLQKMALRVVEGRGIRQRIKNRGPYELRVEHVEGRGGYPPSISLTVSSVLELTYNVTEDYLRVADNNALERLIDELTLKLKEHAIQHLGLEEPVRREYADKILRLLLEEADPVEVRNVPHFIERMKSLLGLK